ncbi:hypothetical protein PRIPAC_97785 [Pristionchus pacificus]|uniref:Uncharacterized protein n=1 Tax=Pristionchus pacificus TaxID=54126 RepID=A0A2A6CTZ4_PRIPA|nr:hypothetical protein PRIPAC_97785 [Pristionchus pacificus]|eukprot:PDM81588.1 hypothetical protein PRIPAC_30569 [Pristionchus pacificus]
MTQTANAAQAMTAGMELLNIHPSASKPSLISSFWSLHVQLPNQEAMDADLRCASQTSLPDVAAPQSLLPTDTNKNRMSKSLTDLTNSAVDPTLFHRECEPPSARSQEDSAEKQRRISFSVQEWLRSIDEPIPSIQMTNA